VFRRIQLLGVLLTWLLATGAQWDFVQVAGWARMIATYSRTMSFEDAVSTTFEGPMCSVCKAVNEAKQQKNDPAVPAGTVFGKVVFVFQPAPRLFNNESTNFSWPSCDQDMLGQARSAPPAPPPRGPATA